MGSSLQPVESNFQKLSEIIRQMQPLRVHAMVFQGISYLENVREKEDQIKAVIEKLENYNALNPKNKLQGIHIDIEPHATDVFKSFKETDEQRVRELFHNYRYLLSVIRSRIDKTEGLTGNDFVFSAATGWWYENRAYASVFYLGQYLDAIVPMAYNTAQEPVGGNFQRLKSKLPIDRWRKKSPMNSGIIIGLGIHEYETYNLLMETSESLEAFAREKLSHSFKGIAFYSDRHLKA